MTDDLARTIWTELADLDFSLSTVDAGGVPTRSLQVGKGALPAGAVTSLIRASNCASAAGRVSSLSGRCG